MNWAAVIVAAGRGTRLGGPKQLIQIAGLPMVGWSMRAFAAIPEIGEIVVVAEPENLETMRGILAQVASERGSCVVRGGATRQQSVHEGLKVLSEACEAVLVHDGARPLLYVDDVRAGMAEVRAGRASLLAEPIVDTVKQVEPASKRVAATLDRATLWAAQTPQFATLADLRAAHERARRDGFESTDETALLERIGVEVVVVASTTENFKVTLPGDVARADAILQARAV